MSFYPYEGAAARGAIDYPGNLPPESSAAEKPKRVSFRPTVTVHPIEKLSSNQEDKARFYLSKEELIEIATYNRSVQSSSKETRDSDALFPCAEHGISGLLANPALRGLELSLCSTRVRNRLIIRRTIFKYHKKLNADFTKSDEEKLKSLAAFSSKLSQWSVLVALEAARHDSLQAYNGDDLILANTPEDISLSLATKRRRITCDE
jgi:hypothetical protein